MVGAGDKSDLMHNEGFIIRGMYESKDMKVTSTACLRTEWKWPLRSQVKLCRNISMMRNEPPSGVHSKWMPPLGVYFLGQKCSIFGSMIPQGNHTCSMKSYLSLGWVSTDLGAPLSENFGVFASSHLAKKYNFWICASLHIMTTSCVQY